MLKVQEFLRSGKSLADLQREHGVYAAVSEELGLAILNYDMVESVKRSDVVRECRALTLELGTWDVVARSFPRFFNQGECPDLEKDFRWDGPVVASTKEDGSLMVAYKHRGGWRVNTRGSFADRPIGDGCPVWSHAFWQCVPHSECLNDLPDGVALSFEFCSPWNKVVRTYPTPTAYLLAAFYTKSGAEVNELVVDGWAERLGVLRPKEYDVASLPEVVALLDSVKDPTFEGFVLRDKFGNRMKSKKPEYVALHHLKDNGNAFATKNILPLILAGETDELLTHFPEAAERVFEVAEKVGGARARLDAVWARARGIASQKEFALFVTRHTQLSAVLFRARKDGKDPGEVFRESGDMLLKVLF